MIDKTETSDGYALRIIQRLLSETNDPEDYEMYNTSSGTSAVEEVKNYKDSCAFVPSLTIEIEGAHRLPVEINKEQHIGIIQNADSWGFFTIDQPTADALLNSATRICELENAARAATTEE